MMGTSEKTLDVSPEKRVESLKKLVEKNEKIINNIKKYLSNYDIKKHFDDIEQLKDEKIVLSNYDRYTSDLLEVSSFVARLYLIKIEIKKRKIEINALDVISRRMINEYSVKIEVMLSEIDDIIQATIHLKNSIDSRAKFFEKSQYILFSQKTYL